MKKLLLIPIVGLQMLCAGEIQNLTVDQTITDSVKYKEKKYYKISVPKGKYIKVNLTNLEADVDLYIKSGKKPAIRNNDCYSANSYTKDEECISSSSLRKKDIYILVNGFKASSYNLKVSFLNKDSINTIKRDETFPLPLKIEIKKQIKKDKSHNYVIYPYLYETLIVSLQNKKGEDADLRIKLGKRANKHTFDCKSTKGKGQTDQCLITKVNRDNDSLFINVTGYSSVTDYNLIITKKRKFYTNDKRYFVTFKNVRIDGMDATDISVINNKTKRVTFQEYARPYNNVRMLPNSNSFILSRDDMYTYTIDKNGKVTKKEH